MKKIINGKRYDTDTAKFVGHAEHSHPRDFNYWAEDLYLKKTGEFFIHGEGGANTIYAQPAEQNWRTGGEKIRPLSLKEAQEWAEKYLDADKYEEIFGKIEEDKVQISAWIPDSVKTDAEALQEKGYTLADIFTAGVRFLDK